MDIAELIENNSLPILEIGPGTGALTQFLLQRFPDGVSVCEIDVRSIAYLKSHYPSIVHIYEEDFLKMDLEKYFPDGVIIAGNFPYNISSQIVFKILENHDLIPQMVGMFQKEVAQRICATNGSKQYGILSVLTKLYFTSNYEFEVDKSAFDPPPKVQSAVISLSRSTQTYNVDVAHLKKLVKAAFGLRRKKLRNSVRGFFDANTLENEVFDLRPEQLSLDDFIALSELTNK